MMIIDSLGKVFVAKRIDARIDAWQMPQGGIDPGETPSGAALREMREEIGSSEGKIIAESKFWYSYDIPRALVPKLWNGAFKGQKQKWFLIKFTGMDSDININTGHPEFSDWRWVEISELFDLIVPFKRKLYESVFKEFEPFLLKK